MSDKFEKLIEALKETFVEKDRDISEISTFKFTGDVSGRGFLWTGHKHTKQFIYNADPERFFSSETIDIGKGKNYSINGIKVLDDRELGSNVTKSSLREVGRLKGLIVDGSVNINDYLFFNGDSDRLGLGTDSPNAALSVCENGIEVIVGSVAPGKASLGTFNSVDLELLTDKTSRLIVKANGDIELGSISNGDIKVSVHGKMGINVRTIDPRATLHVGGAIKFNEKIHISGTEPPQGGSYVIGDIMWNSAPAAGRYVGWICVQSGNPGVWNPFGEIK